MSALKDGGTAFPMQDSQVIHAYAMAASIDIKDSAERDRAYIKVRAQAIGGMTLRDYFAAKAMAPIIDSDDGSSIKTVSEVLGINAGEYQWLEHWPKYVALKAYAMADAMLAARERS